MKKVLLLSLLTLFQLSVSTTGAHAQSISFDTLAGKQWVRNLIKQEIKNGGITTPGDGSPDPVEPTLPDCKAGPEIRETYNVTTTQAEVLYHGEDVYGIRFAIVSNKDTLRSGTFTPVNNHPVITFTALPAGTYELHFIGTLCKGRSKATLVIPKLTGDITPTELGDGSPTQPSGDWKIQPITSGLPGHLLTKIEGEPGNRVISDDSQSELPDKHDYLYIINSDILRQKTLLKNYPYQTNAPIRILKAMIRSDVKTLNQWSDRENTWYFSTTAGATFPENVSVAHYTGLFTNGERTDKQGFLNYIPQSYDPAKQFAQWGDIGEEFTLPKGHVFVANRGDWSIDQVRKKGVTHISNLQLPWPDYSAVSKLKDQGITYNDVPRPEAFIGLNPSGEDKWVNGYNLRYWPNGPLTREQAIDAANRTDAGHAIWISETMEGSSFMPAEQGMWRDFYGQLRKRYNENFGAKGIPFFITHNYFYQWSSKFSLGEESRDWAKKLLTLAPADMPQSNFSPGGTLADNNLILEAAYLNAPDNQVGGIFTSAYRLNLFKKMGYKGGIFLFGQHEWRPNNLSKYTYPDGNFYFYDKLPLDPNALVAYGFIAHVWGELYVEWGAAGKQSTKNFSKEWANGLWFPKGEDGPRDNFPYWSYDNNYYAGYNGSQDFSQFSQALYAKTYGMLEGGTDKYLDFRIDGGSWYKASNVNADDIVDGWYDKRGIVHSRTKDGKTVWFYINPFADNSSHKLDVRFTDGSVKTYTVAGNGIHVKFL